MSTKRFLFVLVAFALVSIAALAGWQARSDQKAAANRPLPGGVQPSQMSAEALRHFDIIGRHGEALLEMPSRWTRLNVIEQHGEALLEAPDPWSRLELIEQHSEALQH